MKKILMYTALFSLLILCSACTGTSRSGTRVNTGDTVETTSNADHSPFQQ